MSYRYNPVTHADLDQVMDLPQAIGQNDSPTFAAINTDAINEKSLNNGVVVEGVTLKDGAVTLNATLGFPGGSGDHAIGPALVGGDSLTMGSAASATYFPGSVTVSGNLTVNGSTVQVESQVTTTDNLVVLNSGEVGDGVTAGSSGFQVDRGTLTDYQFLFNETSDTFRIGEVGGLQAVATREDTPVPAGVTFWNAAQSRLETAATLTWNGTTLAAGTLTLSTPLSLADGGTSASDAATARTNLGLGTSSEVQFQRMTIQRSSGVAGIYVDTDDVGAGSYQVLRVGSKNADVAQGGVLQHFNPTWTGSGAFEPYTTNVTGFESGGLTLSATDASGAVRIHAGGSGAASEIMRATSGKLGVKTVSPDKTFSVAGSGMVAIFGQDITSGQEAGIVIGQEDANDASGNIIFNLDEKNMAFQIGGDGRGSALVVGNNGNVGIGTLSFDASSAGTLALANGTLGGAAADMVQITSEDVSAGNTTLAVRTEGNGSLISSSDNVVTHKIAIRWNGATYYLLATTSAS